MGLFHPDFGIDTCVRAKKLVKMPAKGNQMIPNVHLHKDWDPYVKTWFNQPARKVRRRKARAAKAAAVAPRPLKTLRPVVRCPTLRYNIKTRLGRGFTLAELKDAGMSKKEAQSIGISVDVRRRNRSVEALQLNVQRLKEYKAKLILFPVKATKPRKGDATQEDMDKASQLVGVVMPPKVKATRIRPMAITDDMKTFKARAAIGQARAYKRLHGIREKRKADAEADDITGGKKK